MQNTQKPRILITNDDGVDNANIHALASALSFMGEVFVFAPAKEQSGVGHAFTVRHGICVQKKLPKEIPCANPGYEIYSIEGTPSDCSKFAVSQFAEIAFKNVKNAKKSVYGTSTFDVCFSGINFGENSGVSSLYSGTVAAAREACLWGVPSIALSMSLGGESLLPQVLEFAKRVVSERMFEKLAPLTFLNVNFPKTQKNAFKGFKVTSMSTGMFTDHYSRVDSNAKENEVEGVWQLDGEKLWENQPEDTDDFLLHQGYATITPHRIDQTDENSLKEISKMIEVN